jgi:hypothetical protein
LTDEAIQEAQNLLGVRLPAALLDLLRIQNGGVVVDERCACPTSEPTSWAEDHVPFEHLLGIGYHEPTLSILYTQYLIEEWGLPTSVVLLSGDGHSWIAPDYRASGPQGEPSVAWLDADRGTELALAPDFRSFVEVLKPEAATS